MLRKNFISLHEAIAIALLNKSNHTASFAEVATFIEGRNFSPNREGNVDLATQVMFRSTKSRGVHKHLFEEVDKQTIRLRNYNY